MSWTGRRTVDFLVGGSYRAYDLLETMARIDWMHQQRRIPTFVAGDNLEVIGRLRFDPESIRDESIHMRSLVGGHRWISIREWFIFHGVYATNFVDLTDDTTATTEGPDDQDDWPFDEDDWTEEDIATLDDLIDGRGGGAAAA